MRYTSESEYFIYIREHKAVRHKQIVCGRTLCICMDSQVHENRIKMFHGLSFGFFISGFILKFMFHFLPLSVFPSFSLLTCVLLVNLPLCSQLHESHTVSTTNMLRSCETHKRKCLFLNIQVLASALKFEYQLGFISKCSACVVKLMTMLTFFLTIHS